ncbi:MAG: T9SS type A sorting domain-containing protein, partial [Bacteroidales bacterium]|nr:T9SS type A sorting domain-containing protein [Bacteroidales bacterium]
YDNYMAFNLLRESLSTLQDGHINWPAATPAQIDELQRIAEANTGRSSTMAKGVLCFFFDICYEEAVEGETRGLLVETFHGTSLQDGTTGGLLVYPNPTDGTVTVEATGDSPIRNVTVLDMSGRVLDGVTHTPVSENSYICTLNLRHLDSGIYLIRALTADGKAVSGKVVRN